MRPGTLYYEQRQLDARKIDLSLFTDREREGRERVSVSNDVKPENRT